MKKTLLLASAFLAASSTIASADTLVYFGTYTKNAPDGSKGIYVSTLDDKTGKLSEPKLAAEVTSPSFLEIHPNKQFLYAVSESGKSATGKPGGTVTAYRIGKDGLLTQLNAQTSGGSGPCHVSVDPSGRCVVVANYGGGSCASLAIAPDGSLREPGSVIQHTGSSVNPGRQKEPHAHSANISLDGKFAFVADLGTDDVFVYRLDAADGTLTPHGSAKVTPGSGPRHFAFHPAGKFAWVINEITLTLTGFSYDAAAGKLTEIQTIGTIPDADRSQKGLSTAEVRVHPSGQFVYGSNRGHDTIAVFKVDPATGKLTHVENEPIQGKTPRNFNLDPTGKWLLAAGQNSNTISVFAIDQTTGALSYSGNQIAVGSPVCVRFVTAP
jgi:6-phosphogluconolactonase